MKRRQTTEKKRNQNDIEVGSERWTNEIKKKKLQMKKKRHRLEVNIEVFDLRATIQFTGFFHLKSFAFFSINCCERSQHSVATRQEICNLNVKCYKESTLKGFKCTQEKQIASTVAWFKYSSNYVLQMIWCVRIIVTINYDLYHENEWERTNRFLYPIWSNAFVASVLHT